MSTHSILAEAFESARRDFLRQVEGKTNHNFSAFTSIDQVYLFTKEIQEKQGRTASVRNLAKIQPYLNCLNQYVGVLDTVVQVNPGFLVLIWVVDPG